MAAGTWLKAFMAAGTPAAALAAITPATSGTTAKRPTTAAPGAVYYDTTLGKPVFLKTAPSSWVDATGTAA